MIFSPCYFWYLNAELKVPELKRQLREMRAQGVRSVCPHPWPPEFRPQTMPSDMTPEYLSPAFFDRLKVIYKECARLGMQCCLYDEGGWPSGGAAGRVRACHVDEWAPGFQTLKGEEKEPFTPEKAAPLPNLLISGVAEKFLELTHERYFKHSSELFGNEIPFAFMDEPRIPSCWKDFRIAWAPGLGGEFRRRKGYELEPWIPDLIAEKAPAQVSIDYYDLLSQLFVENFLLPVRDWCRKHHILSGGHFGGENEPERSANHGHGHIMRSLRAMDLPGVDAIWRQIFPGQENGSFPKLASSIAHQSGRKYALAEIFAVYGNGVTPEQRCFLTDYMQVRGINLLVLSKIALTHKKHFIFGCRPHFGPVDPLWKYSVLFHNYCSRIARNMTAGKPVIDTAVYFDQRSIWAGEPYRTQSVKAREELCARLLQQQIDFDFVDDDALAGAKISGGKLIVGKMAYSTLLIPSDDFMPPAVREVVRQFHSAPAKPLLHCTPAALQLRVSKRITGTKAIYFCVSESPEALDCTLTFEEENIVFRDPWKSGDYALNGSSIPWHFEPFGSALFVTNTEGKHTFPVIQWSTPVQWKWQLKPLVRHFVGTDDIQIKKCRKKAVSAELGDWSSYLGADFSGDAVYSCDFANTEKSLRIDLGKVCYCAEVKLNGKSVGKIFRSPFQFDLTPALKQGNNHLEIIVSNTLSNALAAPGVLERITADFPPCSPYEQQQRAFEADSLVGGLFGPVRISRKI